MTTRELVEMVDRGHLVPYGTPGGPAWRLDTRGLLFDSVERHWPIGALVAWNPSGVWWRRWYLLDGHRRVAALTELVAGHTDLVRDLGSAAPCYLAAADALAGGAYLPVNAMLQTLRFLPAVAGLPGPAVELAEHAAAAIGAAMFAIWTLVGGTAPEAVEACQRLLPDRVTAATVTRILTDEVTEPDRPRG